MIRPKSRKLAPLSERGFVARRAGRRLGSLRQIAPRLFKEERLPDSERSFIHPIFQRLAKHADDYVAGSAVFYIGQRNSALYPVVAIVLGDKYPIAAQLFLFRVEILDSLENIAADTQGYEVIPRQDHLGELGDLFPLVATIIIAARVVVG